MRLKFDSAGYVCCVLYGCTTDGCAEYEGTVPAEPEEYSDIDDWADHAQVQAYYLDSNGNLAYDATRAAALCPEDEVVLRKYTAEQVKALGIFDAIYPVGSLYMSMNDVNPSLLFGGTWVQIEDRFLLAAGSTYSAGSENANGVSKKATVNIPAHKHLTPLVKSDNYLGFWTGGDSTNLTLSNRIVVSGGTYTNSASASTFYTSKDGACSTEVTVPPTIPPYMAVYVWQRIADPIPTDYQNLIDSAGNTVVDATSEEILVKVE